MRPRRVKINKNLRQNILAGSHHRNSRPRNTRTFQYGLGRNVAGDEMFTKETAIMGAQEKGTRKVALRVLHEKCPHKGYAVTFLQEFLKANSRLFTDGSLIDISHSDW